MSALASDDPVVREIPVFLSTELSEVLYLIQHPLFSTARGEPLAWSGRGARSCCAARCTYGRGRTAIRHRHSAPLIGVLPIQQNGGRESDSRPSSKPAFSATRPSRPAAAAAPPAARPTTSPAAATAAPLFPAAPFAATLSAAFAAAAAACADRWIRPTTFCTQDILAPSGGSAAANAA